MDRVLGLKKDYETRKTSKDQTTEKLESALSEVNEGRRLGDKDFDEVRLEAQVESPLIRLAVAADFRDAVDDVIS